MQKGEKGAERLLVISTLLTHRFWKLARFYCIVLLNQTKEVSYWPLTWSWSWSWSLGSLCFKITIGDHLLLWFVCRKGNCRYIIIHVRYLISLLEMEKHVIKTNFFAKTQMRRHFSFFNLSIFFIIRLIYLDGQAIAELITKTLEGKNNKDQQLKGDNKQWIVNKE